VITKVVYFLFSLSALLLGLLAACLWLAARPTSRRARQFLTGLVVAYSVASFHPLSHLAVTAFSAGYHPLVAADVPPGPTVVVLLGSGRYTAHDWAGNPYTALDPTGAERAVEAARVFKLTGAEWLVSSGGPADPTGENVPSGAAMRDVLVQLGVPAARIVVETDSRTTRDEAVIVAGMLKALKAQHLVLVTTDLHMRRSLGAFRAMGLQPIPAVARSPERGQPFKVPVLPAPGALTETSEVVHEGLGVLSYALRGWYR
jgi:uncharacterized SAM-binding protein YcdF (DUF218 family)